MAAPKNTGGKPMNKPAPKPTSGSSGTPGSPAAQPGKPSPATPSNPMPRKNK